MMGSIVSTDEVTKIKMDSKKVSELKRHLKNVKSASTFIKKITEDFRKECKILGVDYLESEEGEKLMDAQSPLDYAEDDIEFLIDHLERFLKNVRKI